MKLPFLSCGMKRCTIKLLVDNTAHNNNELVKGSHNVFARFFLNKIGCILSDPINLIVFSSCRIFSNSVTLASSVPKGLSNIKSCTACILDTSSLVNTLAKSSFSSFTFQCL